MGIIERAKILSKKMKTKNQIISFKIKKIIK